MTQASIDRRNMWAERIERCLSSSMSIESWCKLNRVSRSSLYAWLARFREEEPGRFPRRNASTSNWIELTRGGLADSKAIVPAGAFSGGAAISSTAHAGERHCDGDGMVDARSDAGQPICAIANGVRVLVPPGSAQADVACVLRAAMSL